MRWFFYSIFFFFQNSFSSSFYCCFCCRQLLGSQSPSVDNLDSSCHYTGGLRRRRPEPQRSPALKMTGDDPFTDGDDEILESLVKTATSTSRTAPRERKRTRNADRKSRKLNFPTIITWNDMTWGTATFGRQEKNDKDVVVVKLVANQTLLTGFGSLDSTTRMKNKITEILFFTNDS